MGELSITEYERTGRYKQNAVQAVVEPALTRHNVTFTTSTQSNSLNENTKVVRVVSTVDCRIVFGENPTASDTDTILPAGDVEYFDVLVQDLRKGLKIAVKEL